MFARDVPHVANVHDATLMPDDAHGDGVLAHLGGHVAIHLDAQFLQHQQPCTGAGQRSHTTRQHSTALPERRSQSHHVVSNSKRAVPQFIPGQLVRNGVGGGKAGSRFSH